jgi:hypothetical protein
MHTSTEILENIWVMKKMSFSKNVSEKKEMYS